MPHPKSVDSTLVLNFQNVPFKLRFPDPSPSPRASEIFGTLILKDSQDNAPTSMLHIAYCCHREQRNHNDDEARSYKTARRNTAEEFVTTRILMLFSARTFEMQNIARCMHSGSQTTS